MSDLRSSVRVRLAVACGLFLLSVSGVAQSRGLLREVYENIGGNSVASLLDSPDFPSNPTSLSIIDSFEAPTDVDEDYGQRVSGFVAPPVTGDYVFWIATDDGGALFLSTDISPANRVQIAEVPGWTSSRQWDKYPEQESDPIRLVAGREYYIEALMKERGGGDNLAVRWRLPNGTIEEPIPNQRLRPVSLGEPVISQQPRAVNVTEGEDVEFTVAIERELGATYQWQRNGVAIAGAETATLELEAVSLADNGAVFRVVITNGDGSVTSNGARLTVSGDSTPPRVVAVNNLGDPTSVTVVFSEAVELASGGNASNYAIDQGVSVLSARVTEGGDAVVLTTTPLNPGVEYQLGVVRVRDRANVPNAIVVGEPTSFRWDFTPLSVDVLRGKPEPLGPSARTTGLVLSEIHYHPAARDDERNLEFVELYNSQLWEEDLSGYRLSGSIDFVFPDGTKLASESFLVIAAAPNDVENTTGARDVVGPFEGNLPDRGGVVRLRNRADALLLEVPYEDGGEWPVAADGLGHSLVLSRPSYGEGNPKAWAPSSRSGGSAGRLEPAANRQYEGVLINEWMAHTDEPLLDTVELYNYSDREIDLAGCRLADGAGKVGYVLPEDTRIPARGYLSWDQNTLGFALRSKGEQIVLWAPDGRVIDVVRFGGQANGVSTGRYPDGGIRFSPLSSFTPGGANTAPVVASVVINEIMYNPISDDSADEFVELHNHTDAVVAIGGWRLADDIEYVIPEGTEIAAGGYLVVAKSASRLIENYPQLTAMNTLGDFSGTLSNRSGQILLQQPDTIEVLHAGGEIELDRIWITVDEVRYQDGGRWGQWSDGGGSSLELVDPRSDNRLPSNWADSDETEKSEWVTVSHTGRLDNGRGNYDELQILLLGRGECLVDDLRVAEGAGANRVANGNFEGGLDGWVIQGNHVRSGLGDSGFQSRQSLHIRATSGGDNGANRVETDLTSRLIDGRTGTIEGKVRWLRGHPDILMRLHGNPLELSATMPVPVNLGTPGAPNSQVRGNQGPAIRAVQHAPILPRSGQEVEVTAQVSDTDGLSNLVLRYRSDREDEYLSVPMVYRGAGAYSATIPGQGNRTTIAFFVEASDGHSNTAVSQFPANPWNRECLVRWGEAAIRSDFGTYRLWIGAENLNTWRRREKLSNELIDCTFVYGESRVVYNALGRFRGSPFIRPGYGSPASSQPTAMVIRYPDDDLFLGTDKVNLDGLEQPGRDSTLQRERLSYWIADQMNLPFSYQRYVQFVVNGIRKGAVYTDSQHPSSEYVETWFPRETEGELFKIDDWFEFNDSVTREFNENARLQRYLSNGELKTARYRWSWEKKPNGGLNDDHSSLHDLVNALNTRGSGYEAAVDSLVDVDQWMGIFAVRHLVGDWDGYGYRRGKNMSTYKPRDGKWKMILWDLDFALGANSDGTSHSMFQTSDSVVTDLYEQPAFRRAYLRAWQQAIDGPLREDRSSPVLDAVYAAFQANQVQASNPSPIKSWVRARRNYLIRELDRENEDFAITSNGGQAFTSNNNVVSLRGTAPVGVKHLQVNGVVYPVTWRTVAEWEVDVPLGSGVNRLSVVGLDPNGQPVPDTEGMIDVTFNGVAADPRTQLVISEIMYNPAIPGAGYVEIQNISDSHTFDLTGYRINGVDFEFEPGTVLAPGAFAVVVSNRQVFGETYDSEIPVAGEFDGRLENNGETIQLVATDAATGESVVIDEVTYDDVLPWPALADGQGSSLQLVDTGADNRRVAHWGVVAPSGEVQGPQTLISMTDTWRFDQSGTNFGTRWRSPNFDDGDWESGRALLFVENSNLPASKNTALTLGQPTYYFRKEFEVTDVAGIRLDANIILDDGAVVYVNGREVLRLRMGNGTISFNTFAAQTVTNAELEGPFAIPASALVPGRNVIAVEVHQTNAGSSDVVFGLSLTSEGVGGTSATPGQANTNQRAASELPLVWLNEVQPENPDGRVDGAGEAEPWVELFNSGEEPVSLSGLTLTPDLQSPETWRFPDGATLGAGEYRLVWCDGEAAETTANEWHTNFRLTPGEGSLLLMTQTAVGAEVVDYLNYRSVRAGRSYGAFPNGSPNRRQGFLTPTPLSINEIQSPNLAVTINEWMADNVESEANPANGAFDDWVELYNAGSEAADLSGFFLSDNPAAWDRAPLPDGTILQPGGFLVVWASGLSEGNGVQVPFRLSRSGETLVLSAPDGSLIDQVVFEAQEPDVSEGRTPDGSPTLIRALAEPSPGRSNVGAPIPNRAPLVLPVPVVAIDEGSLYRFLVPAIDPGADPTELRFEFGERRPDGAELDPRTGEITWPTTEIHGPGTYSFQVRVTDSGTPPLTTVANYGVQVREVNQAPTLGSTEPQTIGAGRTLVVPLRMLDLDLPAQTLTVTLGDAAPTGARVGADGRSLIWEVAPETPTGDYEIPLTLSDDGMPPLSSSRTVQVTVVEASAEVTLVLVPDAPDGVMAFEWAAQPGSVYRVQYRESLVDGEWLDLIDVAATGPVAGVEDPLDEAQNRFYRVVVVGNP